MSNSDKRTDYRPLVLFGAAMALGPLAALSIGSKVADEETLARANAGAANMEEKHILAEYGASGAETNLPAIAGNKQLLDVVAGSGVFDTFRQAMQEAGMTELMSGSDGTYTVFVPSDEAFRKLSDGDREALFSDPEALKQVLAKHVVPGAYTATDLLEMHAARTLDGSEIAVGPSADFNGHVGVGGAEVIKTNLFAANGVVHVIDRVIQ